MFRSSIIRVRCFIKSCGGVPMKGLLVAGVWLIALASRAYAEDLSGAMAVKSRSFGRAGSLL